MSFSGQLFDQLRMQIVRRNPEAIITDNMLIDRLSACLTPIHRSPVDAVLESVAFVLAEGKK